MNDTTSYTLGVIGCGEFASYLLQGFMRHDPNLRVVLSPRGAQHAGEMAEKFGHAVANNNREVVSKASIILAATRPAQLPQALDGLPWREDQLVISVAAGVNLENLRALVEPADAVLCMPTNSAMVGASILPMYPGNERARAFLQALGEPVTMPDERAFESSAVLGAYYGWLLALMAGGIDWLSEHRVPTATSRDLMTQLYRSVGEVAARRNEKDVGELAQELRTPGGITEHGLLEFERRGSLDDWKHVMSDVLARLSKPY